VAHLVIDHEFLPEYGKLDKTIQRRVYEAISKFSEDSTRSGIHLEPLTGARDPRVRTFRVDRDRRAVVLALGDQTYYLLTVKNHDKANAYAVSRRFTVNRAIGTIEVRDQQGIETIQPGLEKLSKTTPERLFGHVSDKDLSRLGIDENVLTIARLLTSEAHLQAMETMIPEPQYVALLALAQGMTVDEAWAEVAAYVPPEAPPVSEDTDDLITAMRRTPGKAVFVSGPDELKEILAHPFDTWRIFLHPRQRKIALRHSYSGSFQVTGGAGTGKTVTALHRAKHLATRDTGTRVLLTTFTKTLAESLRRQLALLVDDPAVLERIEVTNVDALARRIVDRHRTPQLAGPYELSALWTKATDGKPFSAAFLEREWDQVVLAQDITTEAAYLGCERPGRGKALPASRRPAVWAAMTWVAGELRRQGKSTFRQLVNEAVHLVREDRRPLYDHVIVDEAQDLHPAQWRLLRAVVSPGPDDLFIVGDPHQRIYDNRVSLESLGIRVRGRSEKLKINYRTTQEILAWAVPCLGLDPVVGLDDATDTLDGYRSPMHGRRPDVRAYDDRDAELTGLTDQVREWLDMGVEPRAIGIAARSTKIADAAKESLKAAGVKAAPLTSTTDAVRVGTMHGMKGLEFRCVAVIGIDDGVVPLLAAVTPYEEDAKAHAQDLQKERCLLFVACTRARDHLYASHTHPVSTFLPSR
jgi:hypothetical protein